MIKEIILKNYAINGFWSSMFLQDNGTEDPVFINSLSVVHKGLSMYVIPSKFKKCTSCMDLPKHLFWDTNIDPVK